MCVTCSRSCRPPFVVPLRFGGVSRSVALRPVGPMRAGCEFAQSRIATMLSDLTGGANRVFKAAGLTVRRPPTKEQNVTYRRAIAGALTLNIPTLVAAAYLPAAATATMAVCLAA